MKFKIAVFSAAIILSLSTATASQPKIVTMEDNFGEEYNFTKLFDMGGYYLQYEDEVVVSDDTTISLCVTEVRSENPKNLTYEWNTPMFDGWKQGEKCSTWNISREDYERYWSFFVRIDNGDEIRPNGEADFRAGVRYDNLTLRDSERDLENFEYDTVTVSEDKYRDMQNEIERKDERINNLESRITSLEQTIEGLNNTIGKNDQKNKSSRNTNKKKESDQGFFGFLANIF